MLAEAVEAAYEKEQSDGYHRGQLTGTGISPCAYATFLHYKRLDTQKFSASDRLRMKNGHWQELEVLEDLRYAGFKVRNTGSNQLTIHIGKSRVPGRPDGLITVDSREDLLEIKAMSLDTYTKVKQKGIDAVPNYKCQIQVYMASEELKSIGEGCWFYTKHKDSCRPNDIFVQRDLAYSTPIIEAVDSIVYDGWEPSKPPQPTDLCVSCRHKMFCWGTDSILDMSGTKVLSLPEVVQKWKEGKAHKEYGEILIDEARVILKEKLGDNNLLLVDDLRVQTIRSTRTSIDIGKFTELFGANRLPDVMVETPVVSMRVTEV